MRLRYYLLVAPLAIGALGCMGTQTAAEVSAPAVRRLPQPVVFDLPALAGRSIDEMRQLLGPPQEAATRRQEPPTAAPANPPDWDNTFEKAGTTLQVHFNARTRKVLTLFLIGQDEETLLQRGNLELDASRRYIIMPIPDTTDRQRIIGIKLVPRT